MATLAPPDAVHLSILVHGRTYTCAANATVTAPDFDADVMRANGWTDAFASAADVQAVFSTASSAAASASQAALAATAALSTAQSAATSVPSPSNAMPPGVGVAGAPGSSAPYARADHTHATSVQRAVLAVSAGIVTWVFPKAYPVGSKPVCSATAEISSGTSNFFVANVVAGSNTETQVQFEVFAYATQTLSGTLSAVLGTVINLFSKATVTVNLHCQAALPTQ